MRNWGLLAGLAAILAGLVVAGGQATPRDNAMRADGALARVAGPVSQDETLQRAGFFAGVGLTSPL